MIYFCLDSVLEAKKRVHIRYENGGHFVPDHEVEERFSLGYKNLNNHFGEFDNIHLFDSSSYNVAPTHMLSISAGKINALSQCPEFIKALLPEISNQ